MPIVGNEVDSDVMVPILIRKALFCFVSGPGAVLSICISSSRRLLVFVFDSMLPPLVLSCTAVDWLTWSNVLHGLIRSSSFKNRASKLIGRISSESCLPCGWPGRMTYLLHRAH